MVGSDAVTVTMSYHPVLCQYDDIKPGGTMSIAQRIEEKARGLAEEPILRRAGRFDEIDPAARDTRATEALGERREIFALAMSDFFASSRMAESLPLIAHCGVSNNDELLVKHVEEQLEEMTTWTPLQRPGWTLFRPGEPPAEDHNDGSWLATGVGVWAIVETLGVLGNLVDADLRGRLDILLESEIETVFADFTTQRQWFTRGNGVPACNQWVLPLCGLVEAAVYLGTHRDRHRGPYEMAVANLNRSLDAQGDDGDFVEGFSYASFTLTNWLRAARMLHDSGDSRLISHPYVPRFTEWLGQMLLPDGWIINTCDCGVTRLSAEGRNTIHPIRELSAELFLATGSPGSAWLVDHLGLPETLAGLQVEKSVRPNNPVAPRPTVHMQSLGVIAWRTGWNSDDHAVWIRTSGGLSSHTHADSAHISLVRSGRQILIEAGTPTYGHPDIGRSFASGAGHNILQLGAHWPEAYMHQRSISGWQRRDTPVELVAHSVSAEEGKVEMLIDPTGYDGLERWHRLCSWNRDADLVVEDTVALTHPNTVLFRFHIGVEARLKVKDDLCIVANLGRDNLKVKSDVKITAELQPWPGPSEDIGDHLCLVVRSAEEIRELRLVSQVTSG